MTGLAKPLCSGVFPYFQLNDYFSFNKIWVSYVNSTKLVFGQVPMPSWLLLKPTLRQPKGPRGFCCPSDLSKKFHRLGSHGPKHYHLTFNHSIGLVAFLKIGGPSKGREEGPFLSSLFPLSPEKVAISSLFSAQISSILRQSWSSTLHTQVFSRQKQLTL